MAMGKQEEKLLVYGGVALGVFFFVVKPIMKGLGVDPADQNTVDGQTSNVPADENPFNPQYQPFVDLFNENAPMDSNGVIFTMQSFFTQLKSVYDAGHSDQTLMSGIDTYQVYKWAEALHDALGFWHFVVDASQVMAIFAQMSQKVQVAAVSAYFTYNYNTDLLYFLTHGSVLSNGLRTPQLAIVINHVNQMP